MGRGGGGGGKGRSGGSWFCRIPGFNRIFGPSLVGKRDPLHYVAIARGVRNVDERYLKNVKADPLLAEVQLDDLKRYCSYTDDELRSLT